MKYDFRPLSKKGLARIEGGDFPTDKAAEDACVVLVREDRINRQVVRRDCLGGSLVRVVTT